MSKSYKQLLRVGDCALYHGDLFEVLRSSPVIKPDHTITDPPFHADTHRDARTHDGSSKNNRSRKMVTFAAFTEEQFKDFYNLLLLVTKRWVVMTCDHRQAPAAFYCPEFIRLGAWVKRNPTPQFTGDRPGQGHEAVLMLHSTETKKRWHRGGGPAVWTHNTHQPASIPTQKPLSLIRDFVIDFTDEGETVLDPCMGSGTTGVACVELGRKFIGIESDPDHFKIACERISAAVRKPDIFGRQPKNRKTAKWN